LLAGENFVGFDPDKQGTLYTTQDPKQLSKEFAELRKSSLVELDKVTLVDFPRTARHSELGIVNWKSYCMNGRHMT
jgi:hypothetical protein